MVIRNHVDIEIGRVLGKAFGTMRTILFTTVLLQYIYTANAKIFSDIFTEMKISIFQQNKKQKTLISLHVYSQENK